MEDLGFWVIAGGTALVLLAVFLRALGRPVAVAPAENPDIAVYRDQLAEVERDLARGTLAADEAQRLRTEVARRLLEADRKAGRAATAGRSLPLAPVALTVAAVMAGGVAVYQYLGAPGYPDLPLTERLAAAEEVYRTRPGQDAAEAQTPDPDPAGLPQPDADFAALMEKLRSAMQANPDDPRGLELLARNEANLGNYKAAAKAQRHLIAVLGDAALPAQRLDAVQYMVAATAGYVSPEAEAQLVAVLQAEPRNHLARYFSGLMFMQVGRPDRTFDLWEPLLREGPPDAPWISPIRAGIEEAAMRAGVSYTLPELKGPDAAAVAAAGEMSDADRQAMIEGMVAGLEERLMAEGGSEAEWLQLLNALGVLNQPGRTATALKAAEAAFDGQPEVQARLRAAAGASAGAAP